MSNFKKILIVTSEFPPQPGGIGNHAYNLATQLQINGFNVTVLTDSRSNTGEIEQQFDAKLQFNVVRIKRYKIKWFIYLKRILTYQKLRAKNKLILATGKFSLWMVGLDPFYSNYNKYAVIHGSELNLKGFNKKLINKSLLKFKKIIAVSNFTKSLISDTSNLDIEVIPNGFKIDDNEIFKKFKNTKFENPVLITVGNVSERKGQLNVIKALPLLKDKYPKIKYYIVGVPTIQPELEAVAKELNVFDHLTFFGVVSEQKKYKLLQESSIFVMLSSKTEKGNVEGFGIAILEANALGLPSIGSNNSGIVDAISNAKSGILINPNDCNAILNSIEEINKNYNSYSAFAKEWSKQFEWEHIIKKYLKVFE